MPSLLITGASRGIGLEFTRQYAAEGWRVFATCRDPGGVPELGKIADESEGQVSLHALDVRSRPLIDALAAELDGAPLDILLNNAGVYGSRSQGFGDTDDKAWADAASVRTEGYRLLVQEEDGTVVDREPGIERTLRGSVAGVPGSIAAGAVSVGPFTCMPTNIVSTVARQISADCSKMPIISISYDGQQDPTLQTKLEAFMHQVKNFKKQKITSTPQTNIAK